MNGSAISGNWTSTVSERASHTARLTILLVEDDETLRDSTAEALEGLGHNVHCAVDAGQAKALLAANAIDVLMADINLPDMSGEVLAAEARALHPQMQIVFVTGRSDIRDPKTRGLDPYLLRKPYDLAAIEALLDSLTR